MLDYIANGFLLFSDDFIIIPLFILGFIWFDRDSFYHAACLMLLCILLNVALKVSFQVPLAPFLHKKGFAFPSGHMQLVTVFYLWLAYKVKTTWFSLMIVALLIGIGLSLIHFGYHTYYDVIAALFVALLLLGLYYLVFSKWPKLLPWLSLAAATLLLLYIDLHYGFIEIYVWMAYYALWGLVVAHNMISKKIVELFISHKLLSTLICFVTIVLIHAFFRYGVGGHFPVYIYQLQWFFIGLIIPWSILCATSLMNLKKKK